MEKVRITHMVNSALALAGLLLTASAGVAQENKQSNQPEGFHSSGAAGGSLTLPRQEGLMKLDVSAPAKVRVGDSFNYEVKVTNVTDDVVLHDVKIQQQSADRFEIESSKMASSEGKSSEGKSSGRRSDQQRQSDERSKSSDSDSDSASSSKKQSGQKNQNQKSARNDRQQETQKQNSQKQNNSKPGSGKARESWTIKTLKPGQSRTIRITAASDEAGAVETCVAVTSYKAALCIRTQFVEPELELVRKAPENVSLCEEFEIEYHVKNKGSAPVKKLTLTDPLPDGLRLASGQKELTYDVDGLDAGKVRKFMATVQATKAGEFSSRATATLPNGDKTRSQKSTTTVRSPDLAVSVSGPESSYVNQSLTYTVRVTNTGNAPARDAELQLRYPGSIDLRGTTDPQDTDRAVQSTQNQSTSRQAPQLADAEGKGDEGESGKDSKTETRTAAGQNRKSHTWNVGTLKPGESIKTTFTLRSKEAGTLEPQIIADFVCGDKDNEEIRTRATASTQTELISLPALALAIVDQKDPVPVSEDVTYKIQVVNEGTAPDHDIEVEVKLPSNLKFAEASGDTKAKSTGNTVKFATVDKLEPGETATWQVKATATGEGNARTTVSMTSKAQNQTSSADEPTRMFKGQGAGGGSEKSTSSEDEDN